MCSSFVGVVFATSTGGPPTLLETFRNIPANTVLLQYCQHGPSWILETFLKDCKENQL
jgi:chemotaxis response regulator CheB